MALIYDSGSICPQHWRNGGWMKTGDINPLPIETFIYNGTTWVPVSASNPLPISIATSNVQVPVDIQNASVAATKVTLMPANGIRDTSNYYAANIDWTGYRRYCLRAENLLNQSVTITVQVQNIGDYHKVDGTPMSVTVPANTDNVLITANELPILGQPIGEQIAFRIQATAAPTSGTFTLYAYLSPQ